MTPIHRLESQHCRGQLNRPSLVCPPVPEKGKKVVQELTLKFSKESLVPAAKRREANEPSYEAIASVVGFYENDVISSQEPGKKDLVIKCENGKTTKVQKSFF